MFYPNSPWPAEDFAAKFKRAGYSAIYITDKEAYLKALKTLRPSDVIIFSQDKMDYVVFLSDSETDYLTITFKDGKIQRKGNE